MAKTFNRNPLQVNTPSSKDVKNYFFNHYNWKGVNNDKNFLAVDQETFADAKNVYQNEEGLLRSRPSVKRKFMPFDSVIDFWNFGEIDVYLQRNEKYGYYLVMTKGSENVYSEYTNDSKFNLIKIKNHIYVFSKNEFFYFDVEQMTVNDGFENVYVPNTVFDANGVITNVESKNILTDKERYTYFYSSRFGVANSAYGKELSVKINNKSYNFVFDEYTPDLLTDIIFKLPDNYDDVVVSKNNTYLFFSMERRLISYSVIGEIISKNFTLPDECGEIITKPKFSDDCNYAIIGTDKSVYIVSLVADSSSGSIRFPEFTQVIPDDEFPFNSDSIRITGMDFDFLTYDTFSCFITYDDGNDLGQAILLYKAESELQTHHQDGIKVNPKVINIINSQYTFLKDGYILIGNDSDGALLMYLYQPNYDGPSTELYYSGISSYLMDAKFFEDKIVFLQRAGVVSSVNTISFSESEISIDSHDYLTGDVFDTGSVHFLSSNTSKIFTGGGIYYLNANLYKEIIPNDWLFPNFQSTIAYSDYIYYLDKENNVFSSLIKGELELNYFKNGPNNYLNVDIISRLDNIYFSSDKTLYINDYREEDGEFKWYFPEINKQIFDSSITGLHPISSTEMGIFFEDSIWYGYLSEQGYRYTKSKLELGVKTGSDIIASYDGSQLIFPTERGIVTLSYQDFIASTDQIFTFLSDAIHLQMKEFCKQPVSLFKNDYWIFVYRKDSKEMYVLDSRNNSWWPWLLPIEINKFVKYNEDLLLCSNSGRFYQFDKSNDDYFDYDEIKYPIDWYVESQKLHLSGLNNYKHLINITFNSVIDTEDYLSFFLDVKNYRENVDSGKIENPHYSVDVLRTFVQRLNYFKVNEFQYILRSDNDNKFPLPLSLSSISIKYKIQGQVR